MGSILRLWHLAFWKTETNKYLKVFNDGQKSLQERIEYGERWIELVAGRSQTLLQFNSIFLVVAQLAAAPQSDAAWYKYMLSIAWGAASVPLLCNIYVFLGRSDRYSKDEEAAWTFRNAAKRSLVFNFCLVAAAVLTVLTIVFLVR